MKYSKLSVLFIFFAVFFCFSMMGCVCAADSPSANFTSNTTQGDMPLSVQFNDTSTGDATSWLWDFGDSETSTEQNPVHNYVNEGQYTVSLTAINDAGYDTITKNDYITVTKPVTVTSSLASGTYATTQTVILSCDDPAATIYYANDTTDPRNSSTKIQYTGPITINNTTTLRYAAIDINGNWSQLYLQNYVIGTGGVTDPAWSEFGENNNNTGQSTYNGPINGFTIWTFTTEGRIQYAGPAIGADGIIYIGSYDGNLYALNPDGTLKWKFATGRLYSTPTIGADGTIYVGSYDGNLYALNPDGTLKWSYTAGTRIYGSPAIAEDGTIYVGSYDKKIYALNPDGSLKWTYTAGSYVYYAQPAIAEDGTIYVGTYDGNVYALNPDGTVKWSYTAGTRIYGSVSIGADGTIYVGSYDGNLYALNPDGTLKWNYTTEFYICSSPAIGADGTIYIGSRDSKLYALNPDGTLKWSYTAGGQFYGAPVIGADGIIYIGCRDNNVYALNPDGTLNWTYTTGDTIYNSGAIGADGTFYIGSYDGKLYAFKDLPPVSNFTADVNSGGVPITINFTDQSLYATGWAWDFDNNGTIDSTEQNPTYTYTTEGNYTVSLTVFNYLGNSTTTSSIALSTLPPVVDFMSDVTSGTSPFTVHFTDQSLYVTGWAWDFDNDGIIDSTEQNPTYTYNKAPGYYTVSLTATGPGGSNNTTKTDHITIFPAVNASVNGGNYNTPPTVTLTSDDPTAIIYYTNDTTDPRTSSTRIQYSEPISINNTTTLRYAAVNSSGMWSPLYIQNYVIGTGGLIDSPSATYQGDNNHSGQSEYVGPQTNTIKWIIVDMTFAQDTGVSIGSDGTIYSGSYDSILYAIYPNGIVKWIYWGGVDTPSISNDGTIYIASDLRALRTDGTLIWEYTINGIHFASPVIGADGTIYIGNDEGILYAINPDGTLKWNTLLDDGGWIGGSAAISSDGTIYVATHSALYALNQDGTTKWSYDIGNHQISSPSIGADGTIYIGTHDNILYAINPDGTLKWTYTTIGRVYGAVAIASDGTLYFVTNDGALHALNPDGTKKWSYLTGKSSYSSPIIDADGTVYFSTQGGLFAINPDGMLKWSCTTISSTSNPVIDSDGTLYIGTSTGLYAFQDVVANFNFSVGSNPLDVQFSDVSTGPTSWSWNFGDGVTSSEQNPRHVYNKSGSYVVNLTVTLTNGETLTATKIITVSDITPPTVIVSPVGGVFNVIQVVTLTVSDDSGDAVVYFTTDGSDPRSSSTRSVYTGSIVLNGTTTLNYAAVDSSGNWSPVYEETYTKSEPVSGITVYVQNASYYTTGSLSDQIQAILDGAAPGSTIEFLGPVYENLQLTISKQLNIISNVGTVVSNASGSAVFLVTGLQASGTKISGFTITNTGTGQGIVVDNTGNVTVSNVQVSSSNGIGIMVNESINTTIKNSSINGSSIGIHVSHSQDTQINKNNINGNIKGVVVENCENTSVNQNQIIGNEERGVSVTNSDNTTINGNTIKENGSVSNGAGVYLEDLANVTIKNNQINENCYGIVANNISNVIISNNFILDNDWDGILLNGIVTEITILGNTLQKNDNGIQINCESENLIIKANLITGSISKSTSQKAYHGNGVLYGNNYIHSPTIFLEHNVLHDNANMDFRSCAAAGNYIPGSNWYGSSCKQVTYDPQMRMVLTRTGNKSFTLQFFDGVTGELVTDLPSIPITFVTGPYSQMVMTNGGMATAVFDNLSLMGHIIASSYGYQLAIEYNSAIIPLDDGSNTGGPDSGGDDNGSGSGSGSGDGSGSGSGSGCDCGSGSGSLSGSGSSAPVGTVAAATTAGSSESSGQSGSDSAGASQSEDSKTAQEVFVDDAIKNPQLLSIIGIILLVILVFALYYRRDLVNMIKKPK